MNNSVKRELLDYLEDSIQEETITNDNIEDWHYHLFNEDFYIIGHYEAEMWLKEHDVSAWKAIQTVQEYQMDQFGKVDLYPNPENVVNMLVYIYGDELFGEANADSIEELEEFINQNQ